jgi:hypothetical protein
VTHVTVADLVKRLKSLPEDQQLFYAYAFMEQLDQDQKFDASIESTSPEVMARFMKELDADAAGGGLRPLTEADFDLEDE